MGLLKFFKAPLVDGHFSRVFNAYKNQDVDRQIGDRRIPNAREYHLDGPSRFLPPGFLLTNLRVTPFRQQLFASVTDRRDFYHQAAVSDERAASNMLPFLFSEDDIAECAAFHEAASSARKVRQVRSLRENTGDGFGHVPTPSAGNGLWYGAFCSLFQGDHLGVEFALEAHENLLSRGGLLEKDQRLFGSAPFPLGDHFEGLIIDDYFAIGKERRGVVPANTFAAKALARARVLYEEHQLPGSPEKDIEAETCFKAAGAEIISSERAVCAGLTTVAAPREKRLALSALSLRAAALPAASARLLSRMSGNWNAIIMYRRCFSAVIDDFYKLAADAESMETNSLVPLSQTVKTELILLSIFAQVMATNIAVNYCPYVFASDASLGKGAVVERELHEKFVETLWLGSDKKGAYTKLDQFPSSLLAAAGVEIAVDTGARD